MPPTETIPEPASPHPLPDPEPNLEANGDDETALARLADDGAPPTDAEPPPAAAPVILPQTLSLEERVRRLEESLALLQAQRTAESRTLPPPADPRPPDRAPEPKPTPPPPAPVAPPVASTAVLLDVGKRLLNTAAQVVPAAAATVPSIAHAGERSGGLWLLWDTWAEARAILRMFVDPRYHLPWSARILPLVVLAAILTSKYWVPGSSIPVLGDWLLVKLIDLLLAFLLFKWLGHEARRYRQSSPDLPPSLRL